MIVYLYIYIMIHSPNNARYARRPCFGVPGALHYVRLIRYGLDLGFLNYQFFHLQIACR